MAETKLKPSNIELHEVESGNLARLGYDKDCLTLVVEFKHGGKYVYVGVKEEEYEAVKSSESVGAGFYLHIRRKYEGRKLEEFVETETR